MATPTGNCRLALVPAPPIPPDPPPATVVMMPLVSTLRMSLLVRVANIHVATEVKNNVNGAHAGVGSGAAITGEPGVPLPATVVMMPLVSTLRIRLLPASAMYRLPLVSKANPQGGPVSTAIRVGGRAAVPGIPPKPIARHGCHDAVSIHLANPAVSGFRYVQVSRRIRGNEAG